MSIKRLSQLEVATAKLGMHADGGGLYLQVTKTAAGHLNKSWLFRYSVGGRERQMGLGSLTEIKLAGARHKAAECRQLRPRARCSTLPTSTTCPTRSPTTPGLETFMLACLG